jgi:hypothetical protein
VPNSIFLFKTQNPAPYNSGKFDTDLINVQQNWQKENNLQIANREIYESERSRVNCMLKQHQTQCMSVQKSILERMMCAKKPPGNGCMRDNNKILLEDGHVPKKFSIEIRSTPPAPTSKSQHQKT